jgi:hypothetical protein
MVWGVVQYRGAIVGGNRKRGTGAGVCSCVRVRWFSVGTELLIGAEHLEVVLGEENGTKVQAQILPG